jgi:hypothetical protein
MCRGYILLITPTDGTLAQRTLLAASAVNYFITTALISNLYSYSAWAFKDPNIVSWYTSEAVLVQPPC